MLKWNHCLPRSTPIPSFLKGERSQTFCVQRVCAPYSMICKSKYISGVLLSFIVSRIKYILGMLILSFISMGTEYQSREIIFYTILYYIQYLTPYLSEHVNMLKAVLRFTRLIVGCLMRKDWTAKASICWNFEEWAGTWLKYLRFCEILPGWMLMWVWIWNQMLQLLKKWPSI